MLTAGALPCSLGSQARLHGYGLGTQRATSLQTSVFKEQVRRPKPSGRRRQRRQQEAKQTGSLCSVLLPWVLLPMADKTRAVGKGLPAFLTFIRFLSSVCLLMFQEIRATVKGFPAVAAFKGLFSRVNSLVLRDIGAVPKCLPTLSALEGLLSGVNSLMANVVCLVLKDAATLAALVGFLSLKRNEYGNSLKVIFKGSIESIKDVFLIFRTQAGCLTVLFSQSASLAGPFCPAHLFFLSSVLLHTYVFLWALCLLSLAHGLFHLSLFPGEEGRWEASKS